LQKGRKCRGAFFFCCIAVWTRNWHNSYCF